ncbi:unnamed protein product [Spirodela intermedia]|uniref:Uncharacterized protein n=1 Tax=Spirodela intermedia TaxID=51605 RepID=A0ABN7E7M0_SPIIN|nr:unnamed protein product [Spirodela intermedia]
MEDPTNAVMTLLLPCFTFGQIAEIIDEGRSTCSTNGAMYGCVAFLIGMPCLISCGYRSRLRAMLRPLQEYRELRNRGFDPEIGWHANMARNRGVAMTPPVNQTMTG